MARKQSQDERALRRLIRRATANRDWVLVALAFHELGLVFAEEEGHNISDDQKTGNRIARGFPLT